MVGILGAAVLAALTFAICVALGPPSVIGVACAVIVLIASMPAIGDRFRARTL